MVASEISRLSIQEDLSRLGLLDRAIAAYGSRSETFVYDRDPRGPGQRFVSGSSAEDYAIREILARTSTPDASGRVDETPTQQAAA